MEEHIGVLLIMNLEIIIIIQHHNGQQVFDRKRKENIE